MKAIVYKEVDQEKDLYFDDVEKPAPGPGEVLIKLKYAAINRRDIFITQGLYPGIQLPSILGSDGSGIVTAVSDDVTKVDIGHKVVVNPGFNWGDKEEYCSHHFETLGMPIDGTYAQYVCVPENQVYTMPDHMSFEESAAIPLAAVTAYRALVTRGELQKGQKVLIPGIGSGVALLAMQMAVALGAEVYVTSSSDEKIAKAVELGAVMGINYKKSPNLLKEYREKLGFVDLVIDGVGGESFNYLFDVIRPGGIIVSYGATAGPVPNVVLPRMFFKNMDVRGTSMGSPREFRSMLDTFSEHKIKPIVDKVFPLEDIKAAHDYVNEGLSFGKVLLEIPE